MKRIGLRKFRGGFSGFYEGLSSPCDVAITEGVQTITCTKFIVKNQIIPVNRGTVLKYSLFNNESMCKV